MTFYQFVHQELHKRAIRARETRTQWVYTFPCEVFPHQVRFPKEESKQFNSLYGTAIESLVRIMGGKFRYIDVGLAALAQAYDKEEGEYHAPFENVKPR